MLSPHPDEAILDFHTMSDYKTVMTMKFLARLNFAVQMVKPGMLPLVTIKMVKFSLENGLVSASAEMLFFALPSTSQLLPII